VINIQGFKSQNAIKFSIGRGGIKSERTSKKITDLGVNVLCMGKRAARKV